MQEHVTLLGPKESPADSRGLSSSLPPDLMEQVRGRVRLLALLLLVAFSFDPLIYFVLWAIATIAGYPVILGSLGFRLLDLAANIFLCRYGEDHDFVKVLDFGLVKAFDEAADSGPALTREHTVHGTPAFIAPEQALGRPNLDGRVDIYATGCVAYWLLTGQLVFTADTSMALLLHHVHTAAPPPSARSEQSIPLALDQLVLACLAKDPTERPQSARELSIRLGEINGAGAWTEDQAREWWSRHQPA